MDRAQGKIEPWALTHVANQGKKKARAADKKAKRANPKGKRYMPILDNQYESSVTYVSDSAEKKRSIREKMKNQDPTKRNPSPKEGCTCPDGKCKWLGECLSPK